MPDYFASDVHLRLDRPERAFRFARWVDRLEPEDTLTIVGDLCDFWLVARQLDAATTACAGLRALAAFRSRGGEIAFLPGNHDVWLGPYLQRTLDAHLLVEPVRIERYGLRILLVHGHHQGSRPVWKGWMESRAFLEAFRRAPGPVARVLDRLLERVNDRGRAVSEHRHLAAFRQFADRQAGSADLVVFGHLHRTVDDTTTPPRMVVLGGWQRQSSYLRVDASDASLIVEADPASMPCESPG